MSVTVAMYLGSGSGGELPISGLINKTGVFSDTSIYSIRLFKVFS
jgi:hypothetical protein